MRSLIVLLSVLLAGTAAAETMPVPTPPGPGAAGSDDPAPAQGEDRGQSLRTAGLALSVAAVVSLGVGVYYLQRAEELEDQAEFDSSQGIPPEVVSDRYDDDGNRANALGFTFTIAGVAVGVVGGLLYWTGDKRRGAPAVSLQRGGATLGWQTSF